MKYGISRVWDLETLHCMQIVSGHHSEIWSIDIDPEERFLVSGSADVELRFYTIKAWLGGWTTCIYYKGC
ncbi:hypothetical protein ACB092_01G007600 [Castanea dentata]